MNNLDLLSKEILGLEERKNGREMYALSELEDKAFEKIKEEAKSIFSKEQLLEGKDYKIKEDAFGNLYITIVGENSEKQVLSGSHVDSVLNGGDFDGVLGTSIAFSYLPKAIGLQKQGELKQDYTFVVWRAEESSPKTGFGTLGSSIATGQISREKLNKIYYKTEAGDIPLSEYFIEKYGEKQWEKVLDLCDNPIITEENTSAYEEVHIEQSPNIQNEGKEVGIVVDGIGGNRREKWESNDIKFEEINLAEGYDCELTFFGEKAHTGGTPPNRNFDKKTGDRLLRKDALVGTSDFLTKIAEIKGVYVKEVEIDKETGFTTVPDKQTIKLVVDNSDVFENIKDIADDVCQKKELKNEFKKGEQLKDFSFKALEEDAILKIANIPLGVERIAREMVNKQGGMGTVRATVTDFQLNPEGFSYKIDYRNVDQKAAEELKNSIHVLCKTYLPDGYTRKLIAEKDAGKVSEELIKIKQNVAKILGISYLEIPSIPGQDAQNIAMAGVPTTMTFVGHDGVSHNPKEFVDKTRIEVAARLSHGFLGEILKS